MYVPSAGLFVTLDPPQTTLAQYLPQIAGKKTVLEAGSLAARSELFARRWPRRTIRFSDNGPMLLSLACDNRKFVVERDGAIRFDFYDAPDGDYPALVSPWNGGGSPRTSRIRNLCRKFGGGKGEFSRHLDGGWLPKPVTLVTESGVKYRQCTYVAPIDEEPPTGCPSWYRQRAVCVAEFTIENTRPIGAEVSLRLTLSASDGKTQAGRWHPASRGRLDCRRRRSGGGAVRRRTVGAAETRQAGRRHRPDGQAGGRQVGPAGRLSARLAGQARPSMPFSADAEPVGRGKSNGIGKSVFAGAMQIDVPDPLLTNVIRASQVHCLLAARNEAARPPRRALDRGDGLRAAGKRIAGRHSRHGHVRPRPISPGAGWNSSSNAITPKGS